ncbi:FecR domain-containing protein [Dysgonomonas sp. Marseille-P4677]|uniref:FecR family protein n=1 Tax=Dysgonomonas sp. Marseille-P4677 TaxID=2364790 RepID=UPI0019137395|nr:FecR domain-containing protein [Dysgonomonas sp. Marseille-P4677]MBK5720503.1 FecR domain-containing protein [Dysgonomonas sp. Marseille-P4677]
MDFKLLYKFFEGFATEEEETAIKQWLADSTENEKRFLEERRLFDAILLNTEVSVVEQNGVNTAFNISSRRSTYLFQFLKIAAIVTITLLGSWFYFTQINKPNRFIANQVISVPAGQRLNLTLSDGTNVWLNAKTRIEYPVSFNDKERLVILDGQAYFDVAKDKDAPFRVKTKDGIVEALGTKFDVLAYSDNLQFETVLMEGRVKVNVTEDPSQILILTPNNKALLRNGKLQAEFVDDFSAYQWKEGLISFKNEPFYQIMKSFEKVYDVKVVIENPKISNLIYTGKFRIIDGVDYALRVLQKDVKFVYNRDTERHIIYIK